MRGLAAPCKRVMESVAVLMQAEEQAADRTEGRILRSV